MHLVREHQAELGVGGEVGDAADAERGGAGLGHRDGVAVVEAERRGHAQPPAGERGGELRRRAAGGLAAQDLLVEGAGVLGIDVDGAGEQRAEHDLGAAELAAMSSVGARPAREGGDHLARGSPIR